MRKSKGQKFDEKNMMRDRNFKNGMRRKLALFWAAGVVFLILGVLFNGAFAQGIPGPGGITGGSESNKVISLEPPISGTLLDIINRVLNWLIIYSVPILALMVLVGGYQILGARGAPEKIKSGRATITYAVIGFIIILISKGVALVLLTILGGK